MRAALKLFASCLCAALVMMVAFSAQAESMMEKVQQVCTECHTTNRICLNLGVKTEEAWQDTLAVMIYEGASLTPEEANSVAKYLFTLKPHAKGLCE